MLTAIEGYKWVPICCAIVAFFTAFGIGANDVANAFATSVGAKALTMKQATIIAAIMEFSGSALLGGNVASTIMKGITDPEYFKDEPQVLMIGMMVVLFGVAAWLILATLYALPVSTTHSCIGGIVGMAIVAKGWKSVNWKKIGLVALTWVISPVASSILSSLLFAVIRSVILRNSQSYKRALHFYSPIIAFTLALNIYLILYDNPVLNIKAPVLVLIGICILVGSVVAIILQITTVPYLKKQIEKAQMQGTLEGYDDTVVNSLGTKKEVKKSGDMVVEMISPMSAVPLLSAQMEEKSPEQLKESETIRRIHQQAEKFDLSTEKLFSYLQIVTAVFNSFAHGANDVANAIGPFAACISIYSTGTVSSDAKIPLWVLLLGGFGIVVGLACLGYKVMASIGVNMIKVTPVRGFTIEIGSALVVITGSALGMPLSTTHCKVGSTVGVGLVEGTGGVNWSLLYGVFGGWIITLFICALTVGLLFWILLRLGVC